MKLSILVVSLLLALVMAIVAIPAAAQSSVEPPLVELEMAPGGSVVVEKTVTTSPIPQVVDVCLLEDETGSFWDDIANLQDGTTASDIYDAIVAASGNAQFAVTGFRDYPVSPYGDPDDWVFRILSPMSPAKADWLGGIAGLTAGGGWDTPEAQYDAIVAATTLVNWRDPVVVPGVQRVLVVATDASFHVPDSTHINDSASTIVALQSANIIVIGLKAPGAGLELDALAAATGGSVQPLSSNGEDIAEAILAGLKELTTDVWPVVYAEDGLTVELNPAVYEDVSGGTVLLFKEVITVAKDAPQCQTLVAKVVFFANTYPEEGEVLGVQKVIVHVKDVTPPVVGCVEAVNPAGKNIPGSKNPDGFYQLLAKDNCDPEPAIYVGYACGDPLFGPFTSGTVIKFTEAPGATPSMKKIGGSDSAVAWHITLPADPVVMAVDASGNVAMCATCLVPPPPK